MKGFPVVDQNLLGTFREGQGPGSDADVGVTRFGYSFHHSRCGLPARAHTHGSQANVNSFVGQRGDCTAAASSGPNNSSAALRTKEARANSYFTFLW